MGTETSPAAPERARWPRLAAAPHPQLRTLLPHGYAGFTEATTPRHLVLPATTSVPPGREDPRLGALSPCVRHGGTWLVDGRGGRLRTVVSGGVAGTAGGLHAPGPALAGAQRPDRRSGRRARRRWPAPWRTAPRDPGPARAVRAAGSVPAWANGQRATTLARGRLGVAAAGHHWWWGADRPDRRRGGLEPAAPDRQVPPAGRAAAQDRGPAGRFDAVWRRLDEHRPLDWGAGCWLR
jgi:hypothetical protein